MIGVPICRSRLVLFSGAEIKKMGERELVRQLH
jgi:hypothetical protein